MVNFPSSNKFSAYATQKAAEQLKAGHLVAFPTETVYGLGADATNENAVRRIYEVKGRPTDHPLIVHVSSIRAMNIWAREIPDYAMELAHAFWPGPMTLILKRKDIAKDFITGGQDSVGIRVPSHPIALELMTRFEALGGVGIAAPSANRFGQVSPTSASDVHEELGRFFHSEDLILEGGRSDVGIESTIIDTTGNFPIVLRPGAVTRNDIGRILSASDIAILCSDNEGIPLTLIQASQASLPIVSTNVGSVRDIVVANETGILTDMDSNSLIHAIDDLLSNPGKMARFGQSGKERAKALFSVQVMIKAHEKLYSQVIEKNH